MAFQLPKQKANNNGSSKLANKFHGNKTQETKGEKKVTIKPGTPITETNIDIVRKKIESGEATQNMLDWSNSPRAKEMLLQSMVASGSKPVDPVYGSPDVQAKKSSFGFLDRFKRGNATRDAESVRQARNKNIENIDVSAMTEEEWDKYYEGKSYVPSESTLATAGSGKHKYNIDRIAKHSDFENTAGDVQHHETGHTTDEYNPGMMNYGLNAGVLNKMGERTGTGDYVNLSFPGGVYDKPDDKVHLGWGQTRLIPQSDVKLMKSLADPTNTTIKGFMSKNSYYDDKKFEDLDQEDKDYIVSRVKFNAYVADPTETRARLNSGRQSMRGLGIDVYNKKVTKDDLEKWGETGDFEYDQLIKVYGKEGTLKMFNTISANTDDLDFNLEGATNKNINYA